MITTAIELLITTALLSLVVVNRIGINKTKKRRQNMCWEHKRKMVLGINNIKKPKGDLLVSKDSLKMHNNGTNLWEETDRLEFIPISDLDNAKLFWERRN